MLGLFCKFRKNNSGMLKKTFAALVLQLCILAGAGQSKFNVAALRKLSSTDTSSYTFLVKGNVPAIKAAAWQMGKFNYSAGDIASITLPLNRLEQFSRIPDVRRIELVIPRLQVLDDSSLRKNNILKIHNGALPLPSAYTGKGVLIGIIDTGTDINHPDFKDSTGKTRIEWLWDQRLTGGTAPQPYNYGREWSASEIDSGNCTHDDNFDMSHGTKVAGIAAGNGISAKQYRGIAPEARLISVAVKFNASLPVISDALDYIVNKASALNMPVAVNISLGDYYGSHDGKDLQAQLMDNMIAGYPGRALIAAAGNAGEYKMHLGYNPGGTDTNFTWIKAASNTINFQVYADSLDFKNVRFAVGAYNGAYHFKGHVPFNKVDSVLNIIRKDTLKQNNQRIGIIETSSDYFDGVYALDVTIKADSLGLAWSFETTGNGKIDSWNFDYVSANLPSVSQLPRMAKYKLPDSLQTICTGFQCSGNVITVGNYTNRLGYVDASSTFTTFPGTDGDLYPTSSLGPTRTGLVKPEITAGGENIATTGALPVLTWLLQNYPFAVTQDSLHMIFGGTSASAPAVTGLAALYFEKYPTATVQQLKNDIINCAYTDQFTGTVPNNEWGYGKLDGFGALVCSMPSTAGLKTPEQEAAFKIYPNPATGYLWIESAHIPDTYKVTDITGREIMTFDQQNYREQIQLNNLMPGIYFIRQKREQGAVKLLLVD
jgi:subtilisin family serine protease